MSDLSNPPSQPEGSSGSLRPPQDLPNSTLLLVLGILSIVLCFCYGLPGLIMGIVAVIMSNKEEKLYHTRPHEFTLSSYNNLKTGRICAIIGLSLSALYFLMYIIVMAIYGVALFSVLSAQ